jgi:hypothetical protein
MQKIEIPSGSREMAIVRAIATKLRQSHNQPPRSNEFFWLNLSQEERDRLADRISVRSQSCAAQAVEILEELRSQGLI